MQVNKRTLRLYAVIAIAGDGDSAIAGGTGVTSPSPEWLFSLGTALMLWLALLSLSPVSSAASLASPLVSAFWVCGDFQDGSCH